MNGAASTAAPVDRYSLHSREIDILQAPNIDGRHFGTAGRLARGERCTAAALAEVMADDVLVEQVGRILAFSGFQAKALAWHKPQKVSLSSAMRAVALLCLGDLAIDFE
jgi:hypothetical protein